MIRSVTAAALVAVFLCPGESRASVPCGDRAEIVKMLASKYSEAPRAMAMASHTNLVEIFVSPAGSWTILVTSPKGPTCIIGAGRDFTLIDAATPKPEKEL